MLPLVISVFELIFFLSYLLLGGLSLVGFIARDQSLRLLVHVNQMFDH